MPLLNEDRNEKAVDNEEKKSESDRALKFNRSASQALERSQRVQKDTSLVEIDVEEDVQIDGNAFTGEINNQEDMLIVNELSNQ